MVEGARCYAGEIAGVLSVGVEAEGAAGVGSEAGGEGELLGWALEGED